MGEGIPRVPYEEIRPLIRSGDLLLCQGTSAFARLIQFATGSDWSHVGFILRHDQIDRIFCFESVESVGVQNLPLRHYVENYDATGEGYKGRIFIGRHVQMTDDRGEQLIPAAQRAVDLLGTKYGNKDIGGIALRLVEAQLGRTPRPVAQNTVLICSEYAQLFFAALGIAIPCNRLNYIAPDDFANCQDVQLLWEIEIPHG